jgi:hypothetical protein
MVVKEEDPGLGFEVVDPLVALRAIEARIEHLGATLLVACSLVEARRTIDLAGLDALTGQLCAGVLDLPHDQGLMLRPRLRRVLAELDRLADLLPQPRA